MLVCNAVFVFVSCFDGDSLVAKPNDTESFFHHWFNCRTILLMIVLTLSQTFTLRLSWSYRVL
jgi:hypothetical protein